VFWRHFGGDWILLLLAFETDFERDSAVAHREGHGFVKDEQPCAVLAFLVDLPPESDLVLVASDISLVLGRDFY
jgi:hypothetical protein